MAAFLKAGCIRCDARTAEINVELTAVDYEGPMPGKRLSAEAARANGLCEKCQEKPLLTMHYCVDCMILIRGRKRANEAKRNVANQMASE